MKFKIKKNDIINVLSKVQGITGRKTNLAITTNILISTAGSGIRIAATDLETGFEGFYPAEIETEGSIAINARKIFEIVREFPSEEININEVENNWIEIGNDKVEYHLMGMNPEEFPEIPTVDEEEFIEIDSVPFRKMIERTVIISGSTDEKRAHIIGLYLERIEEEGKKMIRIVSTDGSRLSLVDYPLDNEVNIKPAESILIPKKGMHEVSKFLDDEGKVKIGQERNKFIIKKEHETIIIGLLEGEFPEYIDIINKTNTHQIYLDRQLFLMMLKRMSILSSEDYKSVIFNFLNDKLIITSTNPDIGESKEDMAMEYNGENVETAYNPRFFIDTLNTIEKDKIIISIINDERPCFIEGEGDHNYLTAIMPMRI